MSKKIKHELTYDAPVEDVAGMLADPSFREEVCDHQRVLRHEVSITGSGAGMKVRVEQVQPAKGLPSFATRFVGDEITIVQTEDWTSASGADLEVAIPGKPGDMKGTISLEEHGGQTVETVALEVKVSIPLVGGKIEGLVADMLIKALKAENEVGRTYLAR